MGQEVIGFRRAAGFTCIVNLSESDIELPAGDVVLSSVPVTDTIPSDVTVWLDTSEPSTDRALIARRPPNVTSCANSRSSR